VAPPAKPAEPTAPVTKVPADKVVAILGQPVIGPLGAEVGRLVDVLIGQNGLPQAAVIDFGGFMGVGSRKIAVHWNTLHFNPGDPKYPIVLDLLPEQIKAAPAYQGETKPAPVVVAPWAPPEKPAAEAAKTSTP
jgi:PRC-barrel domain